MDSSGSILELATQLAAMHGSPETKEISAMQLRGAMVSKAKELIDTLITPEEHTLQRGLYV